jgi:hypothetical protein
MISFPTSARDLAWHLSDEDVARLQAEFPTLDVPAVLGECRAWLLGNFMRRRPPKFMPSYVRNWLCRVRDRKAAGVALTDAELRDQIRALTAEARRRGLDAA